MKSEFIKEQHQDLIKQFPDISFIRKTRSKLPINDKVFLIIKFYLVGIQKSREQN